MYANHPEMAKEWQEHTPKGKKLPEHVKKKKTVKHAYALGIVDGLTRFGLRKFAEELRLKLPSRSFHGTKEAFRHKDVDKNIEKKADEESEPLEPQEDPGTSVAKLVEALQELDTTGDFDRQDPTKEHLDRDTMWGSPSHLDAGDAGNRVSDMGQDTSPGNVF